MSLTLAAPLALGLALLVAGPILAHLIRRTPTERRAFGAMLLLRRLPKWTRRRRRIQDRSLLLIRALMVLSVVLAIAGPQLEWPGAVPEFGGSGAVVVVIDDSLSMELRDTAGATLLARARSEAVALVRGLPGSTLVAAVRVGGAAARITPALSTDHAAVIAAIEGIEQSSFGTDLVGGIRIGRQLLAGEGGEVLVFTDEAGEGVVEAAGAEIALLTAQGGALVPRPIHADDPSNVAVVGAEYGSGPEGGSVRIQLQNFGESTLEVPVTLSLPDGADISGFMELKAGESSEKIFTVPRVAQGGVGTVRIDDGRLPADDLASFHLPTVGASRVLVIDGDPGLTPIASEVYYLERALAPWGRTTSLDSGVLPDITSPSGVGALDPELHRLVFMANVADPGPWANRLIAFVKQGGNLVISMGGNVSVDRTNAVLASLLPARLRRPRSLAAPGELGQRTAIPDVSHPLFAPFARGGLSGFSGVRWSRLMTVEPYAEGEGRQTLLETEGGLPLLITRRVGEGRVFLLTSSVDVDWGNLPLAAVYMPLIQSMAATLGVPSGGTGGRVSGRVGERLAIPLPGSLAGVVVEGPSGPVSTVVDAGILSFMPTEAGPHRVGAPGVPVLANVAVNMDPAESDVRRQTSLARTAAHVDPDRFMHRVPLHRFGFWFALMLGLVGVALARRNTEEVIDAA
jgi:hypothetical protein